MIKDSTASPIIPFRDENDKGDLSKSFVGECRSEKCPESDFKFFDDTKENDYEYLLAGDPQLAKCDSILYPDLEHDEPVLSEEDLEKINEYYPSGMEDRKKKIDSQKEKLRRKSIEKKQSNEKDPCFFCKNVCGDKVDFNTHLYCESSDSESELDPYEFYQDYELSYLEPFIDDPLKKPGKTTLRERKREPIDEGYYQSKLAKLYMIERGVRI